jgi:hypothetical protein
VPDCLFSLQVKSKPWLPWVYSWIWYRWEQLPIKTTDYILYILYVGVHYGYQNNKLHSLRTIYASILHSYLSKQQTALSTNLCVYECIITYQNNRLKPTHTVCASTLLPMKTTDYIVHIFVCASTLLPIKTTEYVLNILYVRVHYYLSKRQTTLSTYLLYYLSKLQLRFPHTYIITDQNNRLHYIFAIKEAAMLWKSILTSCQ